VKNHVIARRMRKSAPFGAATNARETVVCGSCGQRFAIHRDSGEHDTKFAEKEIAWVEEQLVWDHIQERAHHGSMDLPNFQ
jgi:transcription elongation factor Elf1